MDFKKEIKSRGLKMIWVSEQIGCKYSSFRVYMNNKDLMPNWVEVKLKKFLKPD
jgi:DNA/RNA endonuclease G (NUC1)